jgi:hypothetical protein
MIEYLLAHKKSGGLFLEPQKEEWFLPEKNL